MPDPEATRGAHFSGDETDKDFQFVAGDGSGGDKTLKYDPKNFSFKLKNRDSVVVEAREGRCSWRHTCCNSLYLALATITLVLIVTLLSTSPQNYRCLIHSTQLTKTMAVKERVLYFQIPLVAGLRVTQRKKIGSQSTVKFLVRFQPCTLLG